jgi:thymidine phosphorylase
MSTEMLGAPPPVVAPPPESADADAPSNLLRPRRLGIDARQARIVYLRADCPVARAEGLRALARVRVVGPRASTVATLDAVVDERLLAPCEAGLSEAAWAALDLREGDRVEVRHAEAVDSFAQVRSKLYGRRLDVSALRDVVGDVADGRYSDVQLGAFVAACGGARLDAEETLALTQAMVSTGRRLEWRRSVVVDKHCVGGLPGNRTTPIVVAIAAAHGLTMPKTSSRAITSPAGTADVVETMTPVDLDLDGMRRVVDAEGGCVVWGNRIGLSPVDDVLIRVERALDMDGDAQLVASVLSKKVAAGSTHVVVDVPVGATTKARTPEQLLRVRDLFEWVGEEMGLRMRVLATDGSQPVGRGIGPALEAADVLAVLRGDRSAPADLGDRAVVVAGALLEHAGRIRPGFGTEAARRCLDSGAAWRKWLAICEAQGGFRQPPVAEYRRVVAAPTAGIVSGFDNRRLARVAKLAGAPADASAGLRLEAAARIGSSVGRGDPLFSVHAESRGALDYALSYIEAGPPVVRIEPS